LQLLAIDELILAVARGRASPDLSQQLRYLRGMTSRKVIANLVETHGDAFDLLAAVYSSAMMGTLRSTNCLPEEEAHLIVKQVHDRLIALLAPGPQT
jgi:hypothetical protein